MIREVLGADRSSLIYVPILRETHSTWIFSLYTAWRNEYFGKELHSMRIVFQSFHQYQTSLKYPYTAWRGLDIKL